jgi:uncharacterized protein YyaL (SSP411 family)
MISNLKVHALLFIIACCLLACNNPAKQDQNRLANASSPYLREHADNPVDWYEWGDEAHNKAKAENKPLLISIGYAACHWCHQMEKESFMDTSVARIMNEHFVCIKVDREERPDIDNVYMHACQLLNNGQAGWPLNAFALPDGKPFFAGTYYSKDNWIKLLQQIAETYKSKRSKVELQANALTFGMIDNDSLMLDIGKSAKTNPAVYSSSIANMLRQTDQKNGGLSGQPKFPVPSVWEALLQYHYFTGDEQALDAVKLTLTKMALGGIYDHVGGGFARYATDSVWRIPHFEKMLYDNAQLVTLYAHAYQLTKNDFFKVVAIETIDFVERELGATNGGFYCSLNADTEAGEGAFYSWTANELSTLLGKDADLFKSYYQVLSTGADGTNHILFASSEPSEFAATHQLQPEQFSNSLKKSKATLLAARNKRVRPSVDNKILTSWNALMLKAYVDAYAAFGNEQYLQKAKLNAAFLESNMMESNGKLWRNFTGSKAFVDAFLDDYALLAKSFIRLYEISFEKHWLDEAEKLAAYAIANFYDERSGFFFFTSARGEKLAVRKIELLNNVIPASNAVMAEVLFSLAVLLDNESYFSKCSRMMKAMENRLPEFASSSPQWIMLEALFTHGTNEVAIMGKDAWQMNWELQKHYLPACIFMGGNTENLPLLKDKLPDSGTLIYVCTNKSCKRPAEDVATALSQIQ